MENHNTLHLFFNMLQHLRSALTITSHFPTGTDSSRMNKYPAAASLTNYYISKMMVKLKKLIEN